MLGRPLWSYGQHPNSLEAPKLVEATIGGAILFVYKDLSSAAYLVADTSRGAPARDNILEKGFVDFRYPPTNRTKFLGRTPPQ